MWRLTTYLSLYLSLFFLALAVTTSPVWAQADAQQTFQQAKAALEAGSFAEARDLAQKAAETDNDNAEVFLLLGRAHYQLGALDEAIAAWRKTLALAPEEPLAKRMLAALGAQRTDVDLRIKLIAAMRDQRLFHPGLDECKKVLAEEAVSDAQRAAVMMLQAHMALESQGPAEAWKIVQQLLTLYPEHADPIETTLVLGQAKLRTGGEATADGLALLQKIVADHGATPAAVTAQYELASFDLEQEVLPARVDALAKWLATSGNHRLAPSASRKLIDSYLVLTVAGGPPQDDTPLSAQDKKALALTVALYGATPTAGETQTLSAQWAKHFTSHYSSRGAHTASIEGVGTLLGAKLPRADRVLMLRALAGSQRAVAGRQLGRQSLAGELAAADPTKVPAALTAVSATLDTIAKEFPAENIWKDRMELAGLARSYASAVPLPVEVRRLKAPDAWAIELALPMIQADADAATVKQAVEMVQAVIADYASLEATEARELTLGVSRRLVAAVAVENSLWLGVLSRHAALLDAHARYLFAENTKHGQDAENAKLSDIQKEFLEVLARQVTHYAAQAPSTLPLLGIHLGPWIAAGHWTVAQQAYTTLGKSLPAAQQRRATLAIVGLWLRQVEAEHSRLIAAGLTVPRQLDPVHLKVLQQCYALQGETGDDLAQLNAIRQLWLRTVTHYANLEYFELAEQAAAVKGDPAVEAADEFAELQLARLQEQAARRQLDVFLKQYNATEKLALSPEFTAAITAYRKLITDRPTSPLVAQAVAQVFGVAALFEAHGAHVVAAGVYRDFAEFAAGIDVLSQSGPSTTSTAERAILAAAGALDARARTALTKSRADRAEDDPPPEELSAEFAAAITAYRQFVETHPDSPLLGQTIGRIMAVALKYAEIDAWEVADGVYADLLASKLAVRRPERLAFARALCVLGPAMPDHARQMLSALTAGGLRDSAESGSPTMLAGITSRNGLDLGVELNGDMGGGGMGGMGMGGGQFAGNRFGSARQPNAPATPPGATATPADEPAEPQPVAAEAASGGLIVTTLPERRPEADRDQQLLAMLRTQEANRASQVAQLREDAFAYRIVQNDSEQQGQQAPMQQRQQAIAVVLSDAELERQEKVLTAAYDAFAAIRKTYPETITAEQARGEILAMVGHWRGVSQWQRAAALGERFLVDNPTDTQLSKLRLEIARDWLAWASKPIKRKPSKQEMLTEVSQRFAQARKELDRVVTEFDKERTPRQAAQWDIANSYLTQARVVDAFSPTLARGQYVRAGKELQRVAAKFADHPQIGQIPQMLWQISQELESRQYFDEAILVWNDLTIYAPMDGLSQQAALKIAQTYQSQLGLPLRAAEAYQELNFARGGNDQTLQASIFQIGSDLKNQKRWVESLHVLEIFVDSFPGNSNAGQALTMIGQIHQTNEAWEDAIAAYRRVIDEFENGQWVQEAKWSIAECTINLSRWREASDAYRTYVTDHADNAEKVAEANRRIEVLKDLARYQVLVDEEGQRKAFDAQFQIAVIVKGQLSNSVKAIIEYRKVVDRWGDKHLADDALFAVGSTYLELGEMEKAREALLEVAEKYPESPQADDALLAVGKSYENEATKLATVSRASMLEGNKDVAQRQAYEMAQDNRKVQEQLRGGRIASLKKQGKSKVAEVEEASKAANYGQFNDANVLLFARQADQEVEALTAMQLADRQDKINAALRKAVAAYTRTSQVAGADKAAEALLKMATIYDKQLKDSTAAMETWLKIADQFSGTAVAEDASWRIAQTYERQGKHAEAIDAYNAFLLAYRRSANAGQAQFAIAENYENLGEWVKAMDSYTNYLTAFTGGPLEKKARDQITWIKAYRL